MMRSRVAVGLAATFAVIGAFIIGARIVVISRATGEAPAFVAQLLASAIVAALVRMVVPQVSRRLLAGAAAGAVALMAIAFLVVPYATFSWAPSRTASPVAAACALGLASALCAFGGATLVRRATAATTPSIVVFSTLVTCGAIAIAFAFVQGVPSEVASGFLLLPVPFVAAYTTQLAIGTPRPWACSSGVLVMTALTLLDLIVRAQSLQVDGGLGSKLIGVAILTAMARWGAGVACRRLARGSEPEPTELPEARLH